MAWSLIHDELPELLTVLAEVERVIEPAFTEAIRPYGFVPAPKPEIDQFLPDKAEWRIGWWLLLPDHLGPYETLRCELSLDEWDPWREVAGWIQAGRYVGHGVTVDDELWYSAKHRVETPAAAAAALRAVAGELVDHLGRVDLRPYLAAKPRSSPVADGGARPFSGEQRRIP
jgi:hypothetical protein